CLCENEADSIVYGMPKKAKDINPKLRPMSLKEIKQEILNFINEE
ncbi:chemotaxis protein CheB, partial [Campylobacter coli]|nr:chemotaxis protein CheB [Campylobacter coli]